MQVRRADCRERVVRVALHPERRREDVLSEPRDQAAPVNGSSPRSSLQIRSSVGSTQLDVGVGIVALREHLGSELDLPGSNSRGSSVPRARSCVRRSNSRRNRLRVLVESDALERSLLRETSGPSARAGPSVPAAPGRSPAAALAQSQHQLPGAQVGEERGQLPVRTIPPSPTPTTSFSRWMSRPRTSAAAGAAPCPRCRWVETRRPAAALSGHPASPPRSRPKGLPSRPGETMKLSSCEMGPWSCTHERAHPSVWNTEVSAAPSRARYRIAPGRGSSRTPLSPDSRPRAL